MKTDYAMKTDNELMVMAKTGDKFAFEDLVNRYKKKAYYLALKLVGDPADASDISQEAFIRIYRARTRFNPDKLFFSWFYTIIANLARNHIKKRLVRQDYRKTVQEESRAKSLESSPSPENLMVSSQTKKTVWEAIEQLSFEHREIIVLRHFEDLSYEEIADTIGIPVGSVMSRLYYARKKLKEILEDNHE